MSSDFLTVEVDDATFTEPVQLTFRRLEPPQRVHTVDLDGAGPRRARGLQRRSDGSLDADAPAWACPVEDSGAGVSWLVYGGNAGLWLAPATASEPDLEDSGQLVETYVLVDRGDIVLAE
ncbi:hypothetical protein OV203_43820 [Nannocystis sp. ILAH1]|uniref:hypothetical protein n=1 Tax=unclassified Nannocystis TaxID=2627009 RepID=UPI00226F23A4|nr:MULTISPECIES: hypothetical protein [unclassified Nannocystis]MCY0988508.1 hypothetical protein [Nannocystis sp. ILAH1]MCY0994138.1 hypothetical protein [Nannocystis sp. ILAH1]MCY1067531.1 hypothetical protein [Nannocystis sp. RBIL2]